ncbi:MAG: hypothetical protein F4X56_03480 [Gammaproteobacteria bacterium]|nr:hypothetical protein [Gammaproteobacteria bacterium]MYC24962.1 hypothetical protein [Gammaproteobacteria bacterium]
MRLIRKYQHLQAPRWLLGAGVGLALTAVAIVCVFLITQNQASTTPAALEISKPSAVIPSVVPTIEPAVAVVGTPPKLPHVDFPPGSWEEACGLNELPPYWDEDASSEIWHKRNEDHTNALESVECQTALETHMSAVNPYHLLLSGPWDRAGSIHFVVLDDPLTFERVFADPAGDLARVQDAISRPECVLTGDDTNWELKETCHADAILNYALINTFCFDRFGSAIRASQAYYAPDDHPTPEQDRLMWKQDFEDAWVSAKCEGLDHTLELTAENYPELHTLVMSLHKTNSRRGVEAQLVELAARLGNETAGLTHSNPYNKYPPGDGYKYGRISKVLAKYNLGSVMKFGALMRKYRPSDEPTELALKAFNFLTIMDAPRPDPGEEIEFDWEWVVRYICVPVVIPPTTVDAMGLVDEPVEIQSCKEIVHELRQRDIKFRPVLDTLDKFEQVAIELGVYE